MFISKSWRIRGLAILNVVVLPNCTPAQTASGTIEWVVANNTLDTLRVVVRYPLDSVLVPPTEIAARQHSLRIDSAAHIGQVDSHQSLAHLSKHQGKWYWVRNSVGGIATWTTCDALPTAYACPLRPSGSGGLLTYQVPPYCIQLLVTTPFVSNALWHQPPVIGLQLGHDSRWQVVLPGRPLLQVFRPQPTGREHDYSAQYRYQLTVGPGLTIND